MPLVVYLDISTEVDKKTRSAVVERMICASADTRDCLGTR